MTPQEKCTSLETSRKLLAAGFPQDTERWWVHKSILPDIWVIGRQEKEIIAAPDAQEILNELPDDMTISDFYGTLAIHEVGEDWVAGYFITDCAYSLPENNENKNLAEGLATVWLWLKERKLI